jgi:hypothetical protein
VTQIRPASLSKPGGKAADAKTFEALIHARKVKNGEDGFSLKVTLRKFVLGVDGDGDEATTLVVDRVEAVEPGETPKPVGKAPTKTERARRAFVDAYNHLANDVEADKRPGRQVQGAKGQGGRPPRPHGRLRHAGRYDSSVELTPGAKTLFSTVKAEMLAQRTFVEFKGLIWVLYPERPLDF